MSQPEFRPIPKDAAKSIARLTEFCPPPYALVTADDFYKLDWLRGERLNVLETDVVYTDAFVIALGPPASRDHTYFGGLPYRLPGQAWPVDSHGEPLTFVAQLCFMDSRDLFPSRVGDLLLIFSQSDWPDLDDPLAVHVEWQSATANRFEQTPEKAPQWKIDPMHGSRYRMSEFPSIMIDSLAKEYDETDLLAVVHANKIGGVPMGLFEKHNDLQSWVADLWQSLRAGKSPKNGRYLCSLSPASCIEESKVGSRVASRRATKWLPENDISWGDAGHLNIFESNDGTFAYTFMSH